jgi:uncharacterized protein YeaO (DUF488 family)
MYLWQKSMTTPSSVPFEPSDELRSLYAMQEKLKQVKAHCEQYPIELMGEPSPEMQMAVAELLELAKTTRLSNASVRQ